MDKEEKKKKTEQKDELMENDRAILLNKCPIPVNPPRRK